MMNKLKVVWLCHVSNEEIQKEIRPLKRVPEYAPWITNLIPLFENDDSIELHIVAQHVWLPYSKYFKKNGVHYHFVRTGIPLIGRGWPHFFRADAMTNYYMWKRKARKIINKIKPDIIHMHGAENQFCTAITQFHDKYPVFITIQGFAHKSSVQSKHSQNRIHGELQIIKLFKHFGYRTKTMGADIKGINPEAVLHWHNYVIKLPTPVAAEKNYDLVFFARLSKDKGIEDILKAVALIKKEKPDISLCVIGGGKTENLRELAAELGIEKNIYWAGFLPTQQDVHKVAASARISVLPTYHDIIPGTIIESMYLKLPVVAYDVGSIHEVNEKEKIISLVPKLNIKGLAIAIMEMLGEERLRRQRAERGFQRALEMFNVSGEDVRSQLYTAYAKVIDDFNNQE
jgi:glycosyltransferase involved in cell wall biosynthesis